MSSSTSVPQLDPSFYGSQIFWLAICFVVLYFFVKRFYIPRVSDNLANRAAYIKRNKIDAENADGAAKDLRAAQDARLEHDKQEAARLVGHAVHEAQETAEQARIESRRQGAEKIENAEKIVADTALREEQDLQNWAANIAKELYRKTTGKYPAIDAEELAGLVATTYVKFRRNNGDQ